jgi:hypothetical protein
VASNVNDYGLPAPGHEDEHWLITVFIEQRKRVRRDERAAFTARANHVLDAIGADRRLGGIDQ